MIYLETNADLGQRPAAPVTTESERVERPGTHLGLPNVMLPYHRLTGIVFANSWVPMLEINSFIENQHSGNHSDVQS